MDNPDNKQKVIIVSNDMYPTLSELLKFARENPIDWTKVGDGSEPVPFGDDEELDLTLNNVVDEKSMHKQMGLPISTRRDECIDDEPCQSGGREVRYDEGYIRPHRHKGGHKANARAAKKKKRR